jgi:hypothetical protein
VSVGSGQWGKKRSTLGVRRKELPVSVASWQWGKKPSVFGVQRSTEGVASVGWQWAVGKEAFGARRLAGVVFFWDCSSHAPHRRFRFSGSFVADCTLRPLNA